MMSAVAPSSTTWPAYITTIRSQTSVMTARSWLTRIMLMPVSSWSSSSRLRIWSWMMTSRDVVGSSASSSRGEEASAIAIRTRWSIPPLNWNG